MPTVTPIYSNEIWGEVIAADVDGVIVRPGDPGQKVEEVRQITLTRQGCRPLTITLPLAFEGIPPWELLEAAGLLPDLTPIPEPEELQLAREKQAALDRLNQSFSDWTAAGWDTGLGYRIPLKWDDPVFVQLKATAQTYQGFLQLGVKSPEDLVPIEDQQGDLQEIPAGVLLAKAFEVELLRQSASERFTRAKAEIARLSTPAEAQDWQPPAWEST